MFLGVVFGGWDFLLAAGVVRLLRLMGRGGWEWENLGEVKVPLVVRGLDLVGVLGGGGDTVGFGGGEIGEIGEIGVGVGVLDVNIVKGWVARSMSCWNMVVVVVASSLFDSGVFEMMHAEVGFVSKIARADDKGWGGLSALLNVLAE